MSRFVRKLLLSFLSIFIFLPIGVGATEIVDIHLFYSSSCPHCKAEKEYLNSLSANDKSIKVHLYEVSQDKDNSSLLEKVQKLINGESPYVPYTVIGSKYKVGFSNSTKVELENIISSYKEEGYVDIVGGIIDGSLE